MNLIPLIIPHGMCIIETHFLLGLHHKYAFNSSGLHFNIYVNPLYIRHRDFSPWNISSGPVYVPLNVRSL